MVAPWDIYAEKLFPLTQIRAEIRRLVRDALSQITSSSASMKWNREAYMKDVVSRYRVRIEGWPHDRIPFKNLSDIQNLSELEMLLRGWEDGSIRFVHITEEQYQAMLANPAPWVGPVEADED